MNTLLAVTAPQRTPGAWAVPLLLLVLVLLILLSLGLGRYPVSIHEIVRIVFGTWPFGAQRPYDNTAWVVVEVVRMPRVLEVTVCGMGLALSGAAMQGVFRNPLVGPEICGVTPAAAFGGALGILLGWASWGIVGSAFAFGVLALALAIYPSVALVPVVGAAAPANIEEVMRVSPDTVFVTPAELSGWERLGQPGVNEVSLGGGSLADRHRAIWFEMGKAAGQEARARDLARYADQRVQEIRRRIEARPEGPPRVMALQRTAGAWFLDGRYNSFGERLLAAGATLQGARLTAQLDPELLFVFDPDVLLITGMHPHDEGDGAVDLLLREPAYRSLRAIRSKRVYAVPEFTFLNEPAENPLLLQWLDEILRPREAPCETREAYRDSYRYIYRYSLSDDQIDRALWLTRNRHSSGYSRFERPTAGHSPACGQMGSAAATGDPG